MNGLFDRICSFWLRSVSFCCIIALGGCTESHESGGSPLEIIPPRPRNHVQAPARPSARTLLLEDQVNTGTTTASTLSNSLSELPDRIADQETMLQILHRITASKEIFLAPRPHGPAIEYTGPEFSRMLKSKWQWFGSDIRAIDQWIEEIATRSFRYYLPYMVKKKNRDEKKHVTLITWLAEEGLYSRELAASPQ